MSDTPYDSQPPKAFWRSAVAQPGLWGLTDLWRSKWELPENAPFATYGSCFAQHISNALRANGKPWIDAEPAPRDASDALKKRFNYGIYSTRTANIYTAPMLALWTELAEDPSRCDQIELWEDESGNWRDSLRPLIEPEGFESRAECLAMLRTTAEAFARSVRDAHVFVFTMGLTEGFEHAVTGQPYALCPGTLAGRYDPEQHVFRNYSYPQTAAAMELAIARLRALNPALNILLTVSPVPLTATATEDHVLLSTTYSKSTLRAVAGDLAEAYPHVDYFPSYEIITGAQTRSAFFEPNMRSVAPEGVAYVMRHFFAGLRFSGEKLTRDTSEDDAHQAALAKEEAEDALACEELLLDKGAAS